MFKNLTFDLYHREDGNYFFAKVGKAPVDIDLTKGCTFLIYVSEIDHEELQIAAVTGELRNIQQVVIKDNQITIGLVKKQDRDGNDYYLAKIALDKKISLKDGLTFMIWINKFGEERLQITVGNLAKRSENFGNRSRDYAGSNYDSYID